MANQIIQTQNKRSVADLIVAKQGEFQKALAGQIDSAKFTRMLITAFNNNSKLQSCDQISFLTAGLISAQLGLEPNTPLGQAYLIPYGSQVQFQVGYRGLIDLAYRSGRVETIYTDVVYKGDSFLVQIGTDPKIDHNPAYENDHTEADIVCIYAVCILKDSKYPIFEIMNKKQIDYVRTKSQNSGAWRDFFSEMGRKVVLKRLIKKLPLSQAIFATEIDNTLESGGRIDYTDGEVFITPVEVKEPTKEEKANEKVIKEIKSETNFDDLSEPDLGNLI